MRDARIRQHPLHVGLGKSQQVANGHRQRRQDREHHLPFAVVTTARQQEHPQDPRESSNLRRRGEEGSHGRGRALIDVRRPLMERHGRDLEREPDQDEQYADAEQPGPQGKRRGHAGKIRRSRRAVDQRDAVQEEPGRERAQQEVLQGRLGRLRGPTESGQDVEGQRQQLDADEDHHQVVAASDQQHTQRREKHEDVVLAALRSVPLQVSHRQEHAQRSGEQTDRPERPRIRVELKDRLVQPAHARAERQRNGTGRTEQGQEGDDHADERGPTGRDAPLAPASHVKAQTHH